jgi:uncharacterized membrane protein
MEDNLVYYLFLLAVVILAVVIVKRIASCMVRSAVALLVALVLAYVYFVYLR